MYFCLRVDLDYVPWDTPDASEFGHGEPAMVLRMLELARHRGYKFHFFISNRSFRAFQATAEAVLNDGHDLDWFCKHPERPEERFAQAVELFEGIGHAMLGMCVRGAWPANAPEFEPLRRLRFLSAAPGAAPAGLRLFPVETRSLREGVRGGLNARAWCDSTKAVVRDLASRNRGATLVVRPQVLAKHDPKLSFVKEILDLAPLAGLKMLTLREVLRQDEPTSAS